MASLLIGCPVRKREWILPAWFNCIQAACAEAGVDDYEYVFVVGVDDAKTIHAIGANADRPFHLVEIEETVRDDKREWNVGRYSHMTFLRNMLLSKVRELSPQLFWSVDSDILVNVRSLKRSLEQLEDFDAIGSKTYLTPTGTWAPNFANFNRHGGVWREDNEHCLPVDVLMAIKLMTPAAYNINYELDHRGEDIGWSRACKAKGLRFRWDGSTVSKHVMEKVDTDKSVRTGW